MALAIEAAGLSKRYVLGDQAPGTFVEALGTVWRRRRREQRHLWALKHVSFEIPEGQAVGIVGRNGAGKSTLLKILTRITDPTEGRACTRGRVGALLEVGTAFHLELTGRENIAINGALLGMSRSDIRRRFDDIVEFSGVGDFLDTPLKRYSSGMYLRLAFAVAAHFEPEVVVVDEVLAVGDAEFQKRCLGKMSELEEEGRTVVFVSHDLGAIGRLCDRAIWLEKGEIRADGPAPAVLSRYVSQAAPVAARRRFDDDSIGAGAPLQLRSLALTDLAGRELEAPVRGEPLNVNVRLDVREPVVGLELAVWIANEEHVRIVDEALFDDPNLVGGLDSPGEHEAVLTLAPVLPAGEFTLGLWVGTRAGALLDEEALRFHVASRPEDPSEMRRRPRVASPGASWSVDGRTLP